MGTNVPEFIYTHNNPTALQKELHECVGHGWFIASSSGVLTLLLITLLYILPSSNETLPLILVIACSFPQLVLLLSVAYRQHNILQENFTL